MPPEQLQDMTGVTAIGLLFPDHPRTDLRRASPTQSSCPCSASSRSNHCVRPVASIPMRAGA